MGRLPQRLVADAGKPYFFPVSQFPKTPDAVDQFFRQQTPDTGAEPRTEEYYKFMGGTMAQLLKQTGPAVLITHSNSGKYGWFSGMASPENIKAIVAYEPGACVFPEDDLPSDLTPSPLAMVNDHQGPIAVSSEEFNKLTKMPILIITATTSPKKKAPILTAKYGALPATAPGRWLNALTPAAAMPNC